MKTFNSAVIKFFILAVVINLQSCLPPAWISSQPLVEHDEVKGVTRYKKTLVYNFSEERFSSFIKNEQEVIKESSEIKNEYKVYDYLQLENRINQIEEVIYFLIDGKIHPVATNSQSTARISQPDKEEEEVLLADSTTVSVVTDYDIYNYALISIQYQLEEELIHKIVNAKDVRIRYYAPPEMITLKLSFHKINAFKALAASD